jgi:hypothetical protein
MAGIGALFLWRFRRHMRLVRWGAVALAVLLQAVMNSPIYSFIGRLNLVQGSTAYQREYLLDQFFHRVDEWWLVGIQTTRSWGPIFMETHDVTNNFVRIAVDGGLFTLLTFLVLVALCFRVLGRTRKAHESNPAMAKLCWVLGATLLVHLVAFMGVSYFDQVVLTLYLLFGLISAVNDWPKPAEADTSGLLDENRLQTHPVLAVAP